jgi:hypothetical protein
MPNLKEKLEQAALELGRAKFELNEAQRRFDLIYKRVAEGGKPTKTARQAKPQTPPAPATAQPESPTAQPGRVSDRIEAVLASDPKKKWNYDAIGEKLSGVPRNTIRALLFKLRNDGKASKVGRGQWKAPKPIE